MKSSLLSQRHAKYSPLLSQRHAKYPHHRRLWLMLLLLLLLLLSLLRVHARQVKQPY
jgi:hypothetical protein